MLTHLGCSEPQSAHLSLPGTRRICSNVVATSGTEQAPTFAAFLVALFGNIRLSDLVEEMGWLSYKKNIAVALRKILVMKYMTYNFVALM
ncbi:unnamed protein product [Strongylus vulgaris]|uniref:Uncharacterized protein n=1 Tax=Strongylus vulgaris TaxID=40348 RepID=A0A3P7IIS5_STRVU|nr:unnamed protein product [Strongylus vulgaris]